jgi:hypothetical protein
VDGQVDDSDDSNKNSDNNSGTAGLYSYWASAISSTSTWFLLNIFIIYHFKKSSFTFLSTWLDFKSSMWNSNVCCLPLLGG